MHRFNDKVESLFTPRANGVDKDRFAYLFTHRQSLDGERVMQGVLRDLTIGEGERILVMCGGVNHTRHVRHENQYEIILGSLTMEVAPLENWASYMATVMGNLNAGGQKVAAVILDEVITDHVEAKVANDFNRGETRVNPINVFYRQMRGLICALGETPLIVRHPLKHDSVLPEGIEESFWNSWYRGSRTLDQDFDASVLVYEDGDDLMAVSGKLRGGVRGHGEPNSRVKL